jgi:DNA-binding MarR family transcriptional regulator
MTIILLEELPRSAAIILAILVKHKKPMMLGDIEDKVNYAPRTINMALSKLRENELVKKYPCLHDMRLRFYIPNDKHALVQRLRRLYDAR